MGLHQLIKGRSLGIAWILATAVVFLTHAGAFETSTDLVHRAQDRTVPERASMNRQEDPLLDELSTAHELAEGGDWAAAETILRNLQDSPFPWHSWAATSSLLAIYRMNDQTSSALALTARVAEERPHLRGLMQVWDGDSAVLSGDLLAALDSYQQAAESTSADIKELALRQLARLAVLEKKPARAASAKRAAMESIAGLTHPEWALAEALIYEAMADGDLPLMPLRALLRDSGCTIAAPCLIRSGEEKNEIQVETTLAGLMELRFVFSATDQAWLSQKLAEREAVGTGFLPTRGACVPSMPTDGFRAPTVAFGVEHNQSVKLESGRHTGSGPTRTIENESVGNVFSVARGCVVDAFPKAWAIAAIEHYSVTETVVSQYGNIQTVFYSAGAAIPKGATLGREHSAGSGLSLIHELRKADHPYRGFADYVAWGVSSLSHDASSFYRSHSDHKSLQWADEGAFERSGDWIYERGLGSRNDLRWSKTAPLGDEASVARLSLEVSDDGPHTLWVFVPTLSARSTKAPYRFLNAKSERPLLVSHLDLSAHQDAWVELGTLRLGSSEEYILEVAADTGESGKRVVLDDVLLVRR